MHKWWFDICFSILIVLLFAANVSVWLTPHAPPTQREVATDGRVGDSKARQVNMIAHPIVEHLAKLGYLKFVPASRIEAVKADLLDSVVHGYLDSEWDDNCISADKRVYFADNEELAEGRIGEHLLRMRQVLQAEGVKIDSVKDIHDDGGYEVIINGNRYLIYKSADFVDNYSWNIAARRFMEIVNDMLRRAGSAERLYSIYGGNEGRVIFLTKEMHDYITSRPDLFDNRWMPYPSTAMGNDGKLRR